jgi:hypothetical protein
MGEGSSRARVASGRGPTSRPRGNRPPAAVRRSGQARRAAAATPARGDRRQGRGLDLGRAQGEVGANQAQLFQPRHRLRRGFEVALLAQEMHGGAVLYNGEVDHAEPNTGNLHLHASAASAREIDFPTDDATPVWCFTTRAVYVDAEGAWPITAEGQAAGFRAAGPTGTRGRSMQLIDSTPATTWPNRSSPRRVPLRLVSLLRPRHSHLQHAAPRQLHLRDAGGLGAHAHAVHAEGGHRPLAGASSRSS